MLTLDCRFLPCPQPVVQCKESVESFCPEEIQVLVDNKPAVENVTRFLEKRGYKVLVTHKEENLWSLDGRISQSLDATLQNKSQANFQAMSQETMSKATPNVEILSALLQNNKEKSEDMLYANYDDYALALANLESEKKIIVFLTSDYLGHGDDILGEKLMASFLSCLKEMHLWQIILLNGGVRLTTKKGKNLEHLQELESNGVKVLVCGACLSHYGLYEEKQVGETTNMLDIITALDLADKVIKP